MIIKLTHRAERVTQHCLTNYKKVNTLFSSIQTIAFIQYVTHYSIMFNKGSCRGCGSDMNPYSSCIVCEEYVSWNCDECDSIDYVVHSLNYCVSK
jgi:hypothetical protein